MRLIRLFFSSPNELELQRQVLFEAVKNVNLSLRQREVRFQVVGWDEADREDRTGGVVRASAVRNCDAFIALIDHNLGSTPETERVSQFEAELQIAISRSRDNTISKLALFHSLVDPRFDEVSMGQISSLIDEATRLQKPPNFLFKQFDRIDDLPLIIHYSLITWGVEISRVLAGRRDSPAAQGIAIERREQAIRPEIATIVSGGLSSLEAARLHIFSAAQMSRYTQTGIGTHEINMAYGQREEMKLTPHECMFLCNLLLRDRANLTPGWYWISRKCFQSSAYEAQEYSGQFVLFAHRISFDLDSLGAERVRDFLEDVDPKGPFWVPLLKTIIPYYPVESLEIIVQNGPTSDRKLLNELSLHSSRLEPVRLSALTSSGDARLACFALTALLTMRISSEELGRILEQCNPKAALFVFAELAARGEDLDTERLSALSKHTSAYYPRGAPSLFDINAFLARKWSSNKIERLLEFYSLEAPAFYRTLGIRDFSRVQDSIRSDIHTKFSRLKAKREWSPDLEKYDSLHEDVWVSEALKVLIVHGCASDASQIGLELMQSSKEHNIREAACRLIIEKGDYSLLVTLLREVTKREQGYPDFELTAALNLCLRLGEDFTLFLTAKDDSVLVTTLRFLRDEQRSLDTGVLLPLLRYDNSTIRLLALGALLDPRPKETRASLARGYIKDYLTELPLYYDVVCWLDRFAYAPSDLQAAYASLWSDQYHQYDLFADVD